MAENNNTNFITCRGFCGSGIREGLDWVVLAQGLSYGCNQMVVETGAVDGE